MSIAINDLHNEAMRFASLAQLARQENRGSEAQRLFAEALTRERNAAMHFLHELDAEPTRSVLFRSAAALAADCGELRDAERFIAMGLSGFPPDEIAEELRDLYERISFERHLQLRSTKLADDEVQMALEGSAVGFGIIPYTEFAPRIQAIDHLLVRTAERRQGLAFREQGPPVRRITEQNGVFLSTAVAASWAITIRVGQPTDQKRLFEESGDVVKDFLECLRLFANDNVTGLNKKLQSEAYYRNFVGLSARLAPDGKRIRTVGFTTSNRAVKPIALRRSPSRAWAKSDSEKAKGFFSYVGELILAHKDHNRIGIKVTSEVTETVHVPPGLMDDIVRPLWARHVRAYCTRKKGKAVLVSIKPIDDDDDGKDPLSDSLF